MECQRCGRENDPDARFCSRCGIELEKVRPAVASEPSMYCHWHKKVPTNLSCGRCGKPVCPKCVLLGPAGPRCKECGKGETHFRPGAVWLSFKRAVAAPFRMDWRMWMIFLVLIGFASRYMSCPGEQEYYDEPPAESQSVEE